MTSIGDRSFVRTDEIGVICTGGTFDKKYSKFSEKLEIHSEPAASGILRAAGIDYANVSRVVGKDSLNFQSDDVAEIRRAICESPFERLVIIHGTSRMIETAGYSNWPNSKVIVFTGAMVPHSCAASDASFNLGFALACARILSPGPWIAMNGEILDPTFATKNANLGRFEHKNAADGASVT